MTNNKLYDKSFGYRIKYRIFKNIHFTNPFLIYSTVRLSFSCSNLLALCWPLVVVDRSICHCPWRSLKRWQTPDLRNSCRGKWLKLFVCSVRSRTRSVPLITLLLCTIYPHMGRDRFCSWASVNSRSRFSVPRRANMYMKECRLLSVSHTISLVLGFFMHHLPLALRLVYILWRRS